MKHFKNHVDKILTETVGGVKYIEAWDDIYGYSGFYQISSFGRVKSFDRVVLARGGKYRTIRGRILKQTTDTDGYLNIMLCVNQKRVLRKVARLVGQSFIPNPDNKAEINHKKGNKKDNRFFMLEWNTHSENGEHAYRTNLREAKKGSSNHFSRLNEGDVIKIRKLWGTGDYYQHEIGSMFGVDYRTISSVVKRQTWAHI